MKSTPRDREKLMMLSIFRGGNPSIIKNGVAVLENLNTFSTQPFFIYAQNIMVYNLTAYNYVSLKDNPYKVYIKLKGIGCTI